MDAFGGDCQLDRNGHADLLHGAGLAERILLEQPVNLHNQRAYELIDPRGCGFSVEAVATELNRSHSVRVDDNIDPRVHRISHHLGKGSHLAKS